MSSKSKSVLKDGYLWRYGGFPIKKWKYWYVVLTCDTCKGVRMKFSATPEDSKKMSFYLKLSTLKVGTRCKEEMTRSLKHFNPLECNGHVFAVTGSDGKRHYIMADSTHELTDWLEVLRQGYETVCLSRQMSSQQKQQHTLGVRMVPSKTYRQYSSSGGGGGKSDDGKFFSSPEFGSQFTVHKDFHPTIHGLYDGENFYVGSGVNTISGFQVENKGYSDLSEFGSCSGYSDISDGCSDLEFSSSCGSPGSAISTSSGYVF